MQDIQLLLFTSLMPLVKYRKGLCIKELN